MVNKNLYPWVQQENPKSVDVDADIKKEMDNQTKYLQTSLATLKKRQEKEHQIHKQENSTIMILNLKLIDQIVGLQRRITDLKDAEKQFRNQAKMHQNSSNIAKDRTGAK